LKRNRNGLAHGLASPLDYLTSPRELLRPANARSCADGVLFIVTVHSRTRDSAESKLYDRVIASIGVRAGITERKMFGARAFVVNGKLCCSVKGKRIMVRVDPSLHAALLKRSGVRPLTMNNHTYPGWLIVQDTALRTRRQLDHWIGLALEYNPRAPASKKHDKRSRARTVRARRAVVGFDKC